MQTLIPQKERIHTVLLVSKLMVENKAVLV